MKEEEKLTFGGHLEVLRKMLFRILGLTVCVGILIFCFKDWTFQMLLAPSKHDFVLYQWIERLCEMIGWNFVFEEYSVNLIATELSCQFMTHLSTSIYLALLAVSPYIVVELFRFISPALYENERKYSKVVGIAVYGLFVIGVLISYYVIFPISFRFLGTYQVADAVVNNITLKSYICDGSSVSTSHIGILYGKVRRDRCGNDESLSSPCFYVDIDSICHNNSSRHLYAYSRIHTFVYVV